MTIMINTDIRTRNNYSRATRKARKHRGASNTSTTFEQKNRTKQLFVVLLIWIGVLGFGMLGFNNAKQMFELDVQSVEINGQFDKVHKAQISGALKNLVGDGFFTLKLDPIKQELERKEWIYRAEVSRRWPSGIEVTIEEQTPIAIWNSDTLLNSDGDSFSASEIDASEFDLPRLVGHESQQEMMVQRFKEFSDMLQPAGHRIVELTHSDALGVSARLDNEVEIRFGKDRLLDKMRQFLDLHHQLMEQREGQLSYIDFRYQQGVAVRWSAASDQSIAGDHAADKSLFVGAVAING